ncbi:serine hydrolase domain-containing protein [Pseudonocardia endophytica]|uniref:serine hydrolase domain-containing protein n=1 Tax=Pseudonocardia endophytica TaxID=401976 RepID=UPI0014051F33|nr:serine hydrolase domain-containing protein [Pseudonocardia endophytica]
MAAPESVGFDPTRLQRLHDALDADVTEGTYDGALVAVGRNGQLAALEEVGYFDRQTQQPIKQTDLLLTMSVNKQFLNVVALSFVERGLLQLTQPIVEVLPEFGQRGKNRVALWHVLTHTSGVFSGVAPLPPEDLAQYQKWAEYVSGTAPESEPGTQVIYSLLGAHAVLASVLVAVDPDKRTLRQVLQDELFDPVGMADTSLGPSGDGRPIAPVVQRYSRPSGIFHAAEIEAVGGLITAEGTEMPGGGGITSIHDLWRFAEMLRAGGVAGENRILSPATIDLATRNWTGDKVNSLFNYAVDIRNWQPWPATVGLGFFVRGEALTPGPLPNLASSRSYGGWGAGSTIFWVDPERDLTFAMLTTGILEDTDHIVRCQKLSDLVLAAVVE